MIELLVDKLVTEKKEITTITTEKIVEMSEKRHRRGIRHSSEKLT